MPRERVGRPHLQVHYEMIRSHKKGTTLEEAAARYGMSVPTCVRAKRAFREGGLHGLIPGRVAPARLLPRSWNLPTATEPHMAM